MYAILPAASSSQTEKAQIEARVGILLANVRLAAQQSAHREAPQPELACGSTGTVSVYWTPSWDASTEFLSYTTYLHTSDCKYAYIEETDIEEYIYHIRGYWLNAKYGGNTWNFGCSINPVEDPPGDVYYIDHNETLGYYMVQTVANGCGLGNSTDTVSMGPLN
jgi:hypothetical protein